MNTLELQAAWGAYPSASPQTGGGEYVTSLLKQAPPIHVSVTTIFITRGLQSAHVVGGDLALPSATRAVNSTWVFHLEASDRWDLFGTAVTSPDLPSGSLWTKPLATRTIVGSRNASVSVGRTLTSVQDQCGLFTALGRDPFSAEDPRAVEKFAREYPEVLSVLAALPEDLPAIARATGLPEQQSIWLDVLSDPEGGPPVLVIEFSGSQSLEANDQALHQLRQKYRSARVTFDFRVMDDV